uniref:CIDE-N domain-containing protein n=1 Tax=Arion vulgaris TaxID=1028688 RepID=A0A0B7BH20_9EUPU
MLRKLKAVFAGDVKAYKVQDIGRVKRIGITARNLKEVIQKGKNKLQIPKEEDVTLVLEDDGTIVDSENFFETLPSQTVFVFLKEGEKWTGAGELIYLALNGMCDMDKKAEIAEQIRELMTDDTAPEKISIMSQYLDMLETNIDAEERSEHEDWFEGLNKKYKTKGEVMKNTAQQRIRSYFVSAKEQIEKEKDPKTRAILVKLLEELNAQLTKNTFHGHYFDRSAAAKLRICDEKGWFKCEGEFDKKECFRHHNINPYASKGYKHLFGLWNLDHVIEKSREIIPTLIEAAKKKPKSRNLNTEKVYKLLFTRANLKLVNISCHKKSARVLNTVSIDSFYVRHI